MLVLTVIQGPDKGRHFELPDNEPQQIGRSSESLPLNDTSISRRHAELTPDDGKWYIRDLESANGTFVNGKRIGVPRILRSGDQVRTGATLFVFGRVSNTASKPIRVLSSDHIDTTVEAATASGDSSVLDAMRGGAAVEEQAAEMAEQHLQIIYEMTQLVGSIFDRTVLLERVMDLIFEHFKPDRGFVLLREDEDAKPEPIVVRYARKPRGRNADRIEVSKTIVQHVLNKSEGILSTNAMTDKRFSAGDSVQAFGIRSAIAVPIKFRDKSFGVIYIDSKLQKENFTGDELRLMTAIGVQTGLALENASLYQQGVQSARLAAVGETVASLSHSIRNMLQSLRGGAEVIELGLRKKDLSVVTNGWPIIARNLDRIYQLTMNMLAFSKHRKPEMEMIALPALLREIIELFRPACERRSVAIITEFPEFMPPVPADSSGLHQAVVNLVSNALDAVADDSGVITVACGYDEESHQAIITVGDNGSGIDADTYRKLFTPFYSTKGLRGTGLGLAVTRKIVREHGGEIVVESEPDQGSSFTLQLSTEHKGDPSATNV